MRKQYYKNRKGVRNQRFYILVYCLLIPTYVNNYIMRIMRDEIMRNIRDEIMRNIRDEIMRNTRDEIMRDEIMRSTRDEIVRDEIIRNVEFGIEKIFDRDCTYGDCIHEMEIIT